MKEYQSLEPCEMGLQIPLGFNTEATEEAGVWSAAQSSGGDVSRIGLAQESKIVEGHMMGDHVLCALSFHRSTRVRTWSAICSGRVRFGLHIRNQEEEDERYDQMKLAMG